MIKRNRIKIFLASHILHIQELLEERGSTSESFEP
jgi:hypothetical protein